MAVASMAVKTTSPHFSFAADTTAAILSSMAAGFMCPVYSIC